MRQQTKSFIVEIKQSRKPKPSNQKPSICGNLDMRIDDPVAPSDDAAEPAATAVTTGS